jgi:hypothetical protein
MKKANDSADVLQIKITLRGSKPPIWRRFVVPGNIGLNKLHDVIQTVMGWYDSHLHAFEIGGEQYTALSRDGVDLDMDGRDEKKFRLEEIIHSPKASFRYEYDFGDGWEHTLLVEKIIPKNEAPKPYTCLAGKGRCPFEDCGGIWGYYRMLEILKNPNHPEYEDIKEWAGEDKINPDQFDVDEINQRLLEYFGKSGK